MDTQKVPISERALLQRINRKLKSESIQVRTSRGTKMELTCGHFYAVNVQRNYIDSLDLDLERWGRDLGVLADWEELRAE